MSLIADGKPHALHWQSGIARTARKLLYRYLLAAAKRSRELRKPWIDSSSNSRVTSASSQALIGHAARGKRKPLLPRNSEDGRRGRACLYTHPRRDQSELSVRFR